MNHSIRARWTLPVLAVVALIALSPGTAEAQGASATANPTDVTITLPDIVVLHYFSSVDVTLDLATMQAFYGFGDTVDTVDEGAATAISNSFTADLLISPDDPTGSEDITASLLQLSNAWAVRAIGNAGSQTQISIDSDASLTGSNGGSIDVTAGVRTGANAFAASEDFDPPGMVDPQVGDVQLSLDLTNAIQSGDYTGTYTLTVTNL